MIIKDDGTTPKEHSYKFEKNSGLMWGIVMLIRPHLKVTCLDCQWQKTFYFGKRRTMKLNLKHECKLKVLL